MAYGREPPVRVRALVQTEQRHWNALREHLGLIGELAPEPGRALEALSREWSERVARLNYGDLEHDWEFEKQELVRLKAERDADEAVSRRFR